MVIALIAALCIASNIVYLAAVTRDLFAFARDKGRRHSKYMLLCTLTSTTLTPVSTGLPFSRWIGKIDEKRHIPVNASILSQAIACLMALIYLGSKIYYFTGATLRFEG